MQERLTTVEQAKAEPRVSTLDNITSALKVSIQSIIEPAPELKSLRFRSQKRLSEKEKIICPCQSSREEIAKDGHCFCGLFVK